MQFKWVSYENALFPRAVPMKREILGVYGDCFALRARPQFEKLEIFWHFTFWLRLAWYRPLLPKVFLLCGLLKKKKKVIQRDKTRQPSSAADRRTGSERNERLQGVRQIGIRAKQRVQSHSCVLDNSYSVAFGLPVRINSIANR